jgi:hypothetical protein
MSSYLVVVSDQVENWAAAGKNEAALVEPIGRAAVADLIARGHDAKYFDPQKSWSLALAMIRYPDVLHYPDAVVFVHVNSGGTTPMSLIGVDCSHAPNKAWSEGVCRSVSAALPAAFHFGGVYTDWTLRGFCFWFFRRLRGYPSSGGLRLLPVFKGKRTVIELGNMRNLAQASFLRDNPAVVGHAISRAVAPGAVAPVPKPVPAPVLPLLSFPPTTAQPGVNIVNGYYKDAVKSTILGAFPIAWLQWKLNLHYPGLASLDIDGTFGKNTANRLLLFQREHYGADGKLLPSTGATDERTWAKLRSI